MNKQRLYINIRTNRESNWNITIKMATASYMSEDVEPKPMKFEDHAQKMEELKQKVGT